MRQKIFRHLQWILIKSAKKEDPGIIFNFKWIPQTGVAGSLSLANEVSKSQGIPVRILTPFDDKIRQVEQNLEKESGFEIRAEESRDCDKERLS